jgi:F0F1-type ATP synthase delta subunit
MSSTTLSPLSAQVRVAVALSEADARRLSLTLERYFHAPLTLEVELAPEIIGGVWVRVGDTVIDGSLRGRLEALRQHLCAQCRIMVTSGIALVMAELADERTETT